MDQRAGDEPRRSPLDRIKAEHDQLRLAILHGDEDELDWSLDIDPVQVGLKHVWADADGKLWVMTRDGDQWKLKRILTHTS